MAEVRHSTPDISHGAELFRICAKCHGPEGGGTPDGRVPRIAGQHAIVLWKQLIDFRHDLRWDPLMEHVADEHNLGDTQAIADVAAYISGLATDELNGLGSGKAGSVHQGSLKYAELCRNCHGADGLGDAKRGIPRIAGQHYEYLRRQIYDAVDGRRPNFSRGHVRVLARLNYEDIMGIADYLSRMRQPPDSAGERHDR